MKAEIKMNETGIHGTCTVIKEDGDPKFKNESQLLYHLKNLLNTMGFSMIKKRMWKDGHLVSEEQQYLREKKKSSRQLCIYNSSWQIEGVEKEFNENGKVVLSAICLNEIFCLKKF